MIGRILIAILGLVGILGGTLLVLDGGFVPMVVGLVNGAGGAGLALWAIIERPCCGCECDKP